MPELTITYLHIMLLYIMTNINLIFENIQLSSNIFSFCDHFFPSISRIHYFSLVYLTHQVTDLVAR